MIIDDCQHRTGARFEIKSEYDQLLQYGWGKKSLTNDWLRQSNNQLAVSTAFPLLWVFAQKGSANFAGGLFRDNKGGREHIVVTNIPRLGASQ